MKYKERDERNRRVFKEKLEEFSKEKVIYIDESGIDHNEVKTKSWSPIGKPTQGEKYGYRGGRTTLIAGIKGKQVLAPFRFEGMTNTVIFNTWIEKCLIPELKEGDIIVLDNASFHKSERTVELVESVGAKLLFLPPYSPDLNPIEQYWAILKNYVRKLNFSFENFIDILDSFLSIPVRKF